jgi:hypothetical protein
MSTETTTLHGRLAAAGTLFLLGLASVTPLAAAPIQLFSLAQLSAAAVVFDYPARAVPNTQPVVPSPYTITGPNNLLTFTEPGEAFVRMDQEPSSPGGGGWFGTFAAGTRLLYTGNTSDADFFGPVTINFANPISEFGLLAQFNDEFFGGPFFFTLFNQATTLGTFSNGVSVLPTFLGARSLDFAITSVLIRGPSLAAAANDFALGPVSAATVPEPASALLLGSAIASGLWARRRARAAAIRRT